MVDNLSKNKDDLFNMEELSANRNTLFKSSSEDLIQPGQIEDAKTDDMQIVESKSLTLMEVFRNLHKVLFELRAYSQGVQADLTVLKAQGFSEQEIEFLGTMDGKQEVDYWLSIFHDAITSLDESSRELDTALGFQRSSLDWLEAAEAEHILLNALHERITELVS